ncbi:hypothetical protein PENTCL1PPCAC_12659, partial [Pristionchus entomophagus]
QCFRFPVASTATEKRNEILADPVIIHNGEQQSYWAGVKSTNTSQRLSLGLVCNTSTKKWEWSDGSAIDYKPPTGKYDTALDGECNTDEGWYLRDDYEWWTKGTNNAVLFTFDIFCSAPLRNPIPSADGCDSFADDSDDGIC